MTWLDYDWTWVQRLIIYISKLILEKRRTNALNVTSQYQVFRSELRIVLCQIISPSLFSPHSCWTGGRLTNRSQKCADHKTFWCLLPLCFTTWMVLLYTCGRNAYRKHKKRSSREFQQLFQRFAMSVCRFFSHSQNDSFDSKCYKIGPSNLRKDFPEKDTLSFR